MAGIKEEIRSLSSNQLVEPLTPLSQTESELNKPEYPLKTEQQLKDFEVWIQTEDNYKRVVSLLIIRLFPKLELKVVNIICYVLYNKIRDQIC